MDLAAFFAEGVEAARRGSGAASSTAVVPVVPAVSDRDGNGQDIATKDGSRCSRSSRDGNEGTEHPDARNTQAGARAGASGRARGWYEEVREQRELREQPATSTAYSSRSPFLKRELEEKTGTGSALPAGSQVAPTSDFDERAAFLEYECGLSRGDAEAQARSEATIIPAGENAPMPTADGLALWRAGLARLGRDRPPCPGYRSDEWSATFVRALAFLDQFGEQASALGWTAGRLFGVHKTAGIVRVDACGALVLPISGPVRAITATEIRFGHLTHRTKPGQPVGVPWWEWGR